MYLTVDRWLEIEMGQSDKNKVVIHVECIRDPLFDMDDIRPADAEHVRELVRMLANMEISYTIILSRK